MNSMQTASPANDTGSQADLHAIVMQSLDDDQAQETVSIPLAGKSSIADHMVIASGRSSRQVASMAQKLAERIKQQTGRSARIEGLPRTCQNPPALAPETLDCRMTDSPARTGQ